ncbi:DUF7723 family protein [Adlercreutzia caecimuris]|mgnify:CR=1 FL=1|jgi:hypothetical protein|uniref:DUF7723 family protein n=1 Tax=Adlercreutzia caecimuris TaxID=671266 RepID=UPI00242BD97F|nr:hypothetical protein [Adlercreutzia caecimuris]MCI9207462.1 hypothetical protein [Adlercreutzia caecimuris]
MPDVAQIADDADVIVNGYAFTHAENGSVRVLNLNRPTSAAVFGPKEELWETTMDDIELEIVREYLARSLKYLAA